jgi:hypothetical protein
MVSEIANEVGISRGFTNTVLTELLSLEQEQLCLETTQDMLECASRDLEFL